MSSTARRLRRHADPMRQRVHAAEKIVADNTADDLHRKLVRDAVGGKATDMVFMIPALRKIAKERGIPLDAAFTQFDAEVREKRHGLGPPL